MAAGNVIPYALNMTDLAVSGGIDLDSDTIVCVLVGTGYTPNRLTHDSRSDVSANELATGGGYTQGGIELANKSVTYDSGTGYGKWDADDVQWNAPCTFTGAKYAVLVRRAGASLAAGDLLIGYADLNTASGSATFDAAGDLYKITWSANGIIRLSGNAS
jgi:hypothetical protein